MQVEQQNKINGIDSLRNTDQKDQKQVNDMYTPSTSKQNKLNSISTPSTSQNEPNNISVFDLPTSVNGGNNNIDETYSTCDLVNEKASPKISDQSKIKCDVDQNDESKQSINNEN